MRFPLIFLAVSIAACSSDHVVDTPTAHATSLVLTPSSATIDTAGTLQLQWVVVWSDGAQHPATVTLSATGGTISAIGLYKAATAAGHFLVIAACTCGLTDTMAVTVADQPGPRTVASLSISVSGLPAGKPAQLSVTGPNGYHRDVTTSVTLDSLAPGEYSLQAASAMVGVDLYAPVPVGQSMTLAAADTKNIQFTYAKVDRPVSTGLPAHPRVWMTPARLTQLRAQAAANTIRWQRVKAAADAQVAKGATVAGGDGGDVAYLGHLGLAYLATGNAAYATRAGTILTAYAVEGNNLQSGSAYDYRANMPLVTMGLDWCYTGLTTAQRHQAATWLMNRADWVWPESNPSRVGGWGTTDYQDNYYLGFMMTGPAALAAAGDDIGAGAVSGSDRPAYHQTLALSKWNNTLVPYFATLGAGGGWSEGVGYGVGDTRSVARFADAFLTAGEPLDNPWFTSAIRWLLHTTMPGGKFKSPIGDQPRVSNAPMFPYDRVAMLDAIGPAKLSAPLAAQVQAWLNLIGQVPTSEIGAAAVLTSELLYYDPAQPAASDLSGLTNDYLDQGDGVFIYRQGWTDPNATVLVFRSGPVSESHSGLDANSLRIWKGNFWLSADANIYSVSGIQQTTNMYNALTVGGIGQTHFNGGQIVAIPQVSNQLVVVRGQAQAAYITDPSHHPTVGSVSDYLRTVAYLPQQDVFVIVDRATVVDASKAKVWRWQMKDIPQVSGNAFRLQNPAGDARCFGSVLLPTDAVLGVENYGTSNAVTVSMVGRASDLVVTVLQCTNALAAPFIPTITTNATETAVTFGTNRVTVPVDEAQPVRSETAAILLDH